VQAHRVGTRGRQQGRRGDRKPARHLDRRPAIEIAGHKNVIVRNCKIDHRGWLGYRLLERQRTAHRERRRHVTAAPPKGKNAGEFVDIGGQSSTGVVITHARLTRGSSGIYLLSCDGAHLDFIEGHDFRGPFPRGQLAQFDKCDKPVLEDFSCENPPDSSWPEDIVSVYRSSNATIRRGLVDGNNSTSGVGIMFELSDATSTGGLVEDVDAVRQANGCFSGTPRKGDISAHPLARQPLHDQGRGKPLSNGLAWAAGTRPRLVVDQPRRLRYFGLCGGLTWRTENFTKSELTKEDFAPRKRSVCRSAGDVSAGQILSLLRAGERHGDVEAAGATLGWLLELQRTQLGDDAAGELDGDAGRLRDGGHDLTAVTDLDRDDHDACAAGSSCSACA